MRTFSTNTESEITNTVTRPLFLFEMAFATPLRLSSRETLTWNANSYTAANIQYQGNRLRFYNESFNYSSRFLTEKTAGIGCKIWQLYGEGPFAVADADLIFDGALGEASVGEYIEVNLVDNPVLFGPRLFPVEPTFNHIPPDGTEFTTPTGVYRIERAR